MSTNNLNPLQPKNNDKFFNSANSILYVYQGKYDVDLTKTGNFTPMASLGAPSGTFVGSVKAEDIEKAHIDYISSNNLNYAAILPVTNLQVTSEHSDQILTSGTADVIVSWDYTDSDGSGSIHGADGTIIDNTIDGFLVQSYANKSANSPHIFVDTNAATVVKFIVGQTHYQFAVTGDMNSWFNFAVIAYRSVTADATHGSIIKSSRNLTVPYQPAPYMRFNGIDIKDINVSVQNMADYGVIEPVEKKSAFPKYGAKIANEYFPLIDRVALVDTATPKALTALLNTCIAAKTALSNLLFSDLFQKSSSSVQGVPTNQWSPLYSGSQYTYTADGTGIWYANDPVALNQNLPHYIGKDARAAFEKKFADYDSAYAELLQATNLLEKLRGISADTTLVSELADSVLNSTEKVNIKALADTVLANKTSVLLDMEKYRNLDWQTAVTRDYNALNTELAVKNRLSYISTTKSYGTVADHPILFNLTTSSRFESVNDVIAFATAISAWNTTYSSATDSIKQTKAAFLAYKTTWTKDISFYTLFTGFEVSEELIRTAKKLKKDIEVSWASIKDTLDLLGLVEGVTLALANLAAEMNLTRVCFSGSVKGSTTLNTVTTSTIFFQAPTEAEALYLRLTELDTEYNLVKASHAYAQATAINLTEGLSSNPASIPSPTSLSLVFGTDTDGDGAIDSTVSWAFADTTSISGFYVLVKPQSTDTIATRSCKVVFLDKDTDRVANTELTHVYDLAAKKYVNMYVMAYRVVSKSVYNSSSIPAANKYILKGATTKYFLFSPVTRLVNSGPLPQVTEHYTPLNFIGITKPVGIKNLDYWLNSSRTVTSEGILPHTWGQYNGKTFRQVTGEEAAARLPKTITSDFVISSNVEPLNKSGFYWYNTSVSTVSGVKAGVKAYWDNNHGLWVFPNFNSHWTGTAITASSITAIAYEGSLYLNATTYQIFRARNGMWSQFVDLTANEVGTIPPVKSLTVKRYYDKTGWKYYVRSSITLDWIEQDLLLKSPLKTATVPTPSGK